MTMPQIIDVAYSISSTTPIAADHGYALYGAISNVVPELHGLDTVGIHPIAGTQIGNRLLQVTDRSRLIIRCSTDQISQVIGLSGKSLGLAEARLRVGVPQVYALRPVNVLRARLVTVKMPVSSAIEIDEPSFLSAVRRQLDELGMSKHACVCLGKRRTLNVKGKEIVGYETIVEELSAKESLDLQQRGIGGRRKMGCGVFAAWNGKESKDGE